jgi:stage II sporulation protein D
MRLFSSSTTASLVILYALAIAPLVQSQDRPRRVDGAGGDWTVPERVEVKTGRMTNEPVVRIGLTTGARSVSISTAAPSLQCTAIDGHATPLNVARVRVDARSIGPAPVAVTTYRVELAGYTTQAAAELDAKEIREQSSEAVTVTAGAAPNTWKLQIGEPKIARAEAEELQARLDDQGVGNATIAISAPPAPAGPTPEALATRAKTANGIKPVVYSFSPSREISVSTGAGSAMTSRAPLAFGSDGDGKAPVVYNNSPYRGKIEVFANSSGSLTVVNVVSMEDYVKGVVPNELPPGSFPALEALKAQAVAARTYAVKNIGQFASEGFDLLPTTRSQVYRGYGSEQPLSSRAVDETRGIVATYQGEPINALYTSTCGGRTEDAGNIFNHPEPYLRGRECSLEGQSEFTPFTIKTERDVSEIKNEANSAFVRAAAVLSVFGFPLGSDRLNDDWLNGPTAQMEVRNWIAGVSRLTHQPVPAMGDDVTNPAGFSTALVLALYGDNRADTLLDAADANYNLAFRDGQDVPERNRADVAMLVRDGVLSLGADASLRPRGPMARGRMLHAVYRALDQRNLLPLQKGTTKPSGPAGLVFRVVKGRDQTVKVSTNAFLFRAFGDGLFQVRAVAVMGGEPVVYHSNAAGEVDYLELRPSPSGGSAERVSNYTNWSKDMSLSAVRSRLARWSHGIGTLNDIRVAQQGSSRRVIDLELIGSTGTGHLRGGAIRSALHLSDQLFVIDRSYNGGGQPVSFTFIGRGLGHGVGMCQVGAYGMAKAGLNFERILKAYYSGIDLTKMY